MYESGGLVYADSNLFILGTSFGHIDSLYHTFTTDIYLSKLDTRGNVIWSKKYGNLVNDKALDLILTTDNNLVF
ncbi:MAG TPA: hypothetical protein VJ111_06350, partial [Chitinophagaceae bacterium]|nr:hypothetical protein [Chitinophagaceae bacterium]